MRCASKPEVKNLNFKLNQSVRARTSMRIAFEPQLNKQLLTGLFPSKKRAGDLRRLSLSSMIESFVVLAKPQLQIGASNPEDLHLGGRFETSQS